MTHLPGEPGELQELLRTATDHVTAPDLAAGAWAEAGRRRRRRRVAVAGAGVAAVVAVLVVPLALDGGRSGRTPARPAAPSGTTQAVWDPFTVVDAPVRDSVLPQDLAPPASAPDIDDEPLAAAVLAWPEEGRDLRLLGTRGDWREVSGTADPPGAYARPMVGAPAISHDGTRVAMSTDAGLLVVDVTTGETETLPWPEQVAPPWDTAPGLRWLADDAALVVHHWQGPWVVGLDGTAAPAPYRARYAGPVAVDPDGPVVELAGDTLLTWDGDRVGSRAPTAFWGERLVAGHGLVALTGAPESGAYGRNGPMVVDRRTGEVMAYAPIRDRDSVYSDNGHLTAQGFLDEDTVLLLVGPMDFRTMAPGDERWHLVAWDFRTGEFELVSSGGTAMRTVVVAPALVGPQ